ncbi:hypothetical protein [Nostoc favosum]|nr:hypothetical protein [Nostoc favosum]
MHKLVILSPINLRVTRSPSAIALRHRISPSTTRTNHTVQQ